MKRNDELLLLATLGCNCNLGVIEPGITILLQYYYCNIITIIYQVGRGKQMLGVRGNFVHIGLVLEG